jgi:uncharacterized protein YjbI with pentapeptide repeats
MNAQLQEARLEGVALRTVFFLESVHFEGANLRGINLEEGSLHGPQGAYRRSKKTNVYQGPAGGALLSSCARTSRERSSGTRPWRAATSREPHSH